MKIRHVVARSLLHIARELVTSAKHFQIGRRYNDMRGKFEHPNGSQFRADVKNASFLVKEDGLIWYSGNWNHGKWYGVYWKNGLWRQGHWYDGTWENGTWKDGIWHNGIWKGGTWEKGIWLGGYDKFNHFHPKDDSPDKWADGDARTETWTIIDTRHGNSEICSFDLDRNKTVDDRMDAFDEKLQENGIDLDKLGKYMDMYMEDDDLVILDEKEEEYYRMTLKK